MQRAIIYCRVSSDRQRIEGHGLESQEQRCRVYADTKGYKVEKVFRDSTTAGGDFLKRQAMVALLEYLDKRPHIEYVVIFDDLKRFARDTVFHWKLRSELGARSARPECLNFKFEDTPEGEFIETIIAAQGQLERQQNRRQVIQKQKARLERGYWPFGAVSGYKQVMTKEHGMLLTPKDPQASILHEALTGFGNGRFATKTEVAAFLRKAGYAKNPTIETVNRLMDNLPIYAGYIEYQKWEVPLMAGYHDPIVSHKTYEAIKEKLAQNNRTHVRQEIHPDFPLRGFLLCCECSKPVTASWSKSRNGRKYAYYRCNSKGCGLNGKSIAKAVVEDDFEELLRKIRPSPQVLRLTESIIRDLWRKKMREVDKTVKARQTHLDGLEVEKKKLIQLVVKTDDIDLKAAYEEQLSDVSQEVVVLKNQIMSPEEKRLNIETATEIVFDFLENPLKQWQSGDIHTQRLVLKLVFEQPLTYNRKSGFETANLSLPLRVFSLPDTQNVANVEKGGIEPPSESGHRYESTMRS